MTATVIAGSPRGRCGASWSPSTFRPKPYLPPPTTITAANYHQHHLLSTTTHHPNPDADADAEPGPGQHDRYCEETVDFLSAVNDYRKAYKSATSTATVGEHAVETRDSTGEEKLSWGDGEGEGEDASRQKQRTYSNPMHDGKVAVERSSSAAAAEAAAAATEARVAVLEPFQSPWPA